MTSWWSIMSGMQTRRLRGAMTEQEKRLSDDAPVPGTGERRAYSETTYVRPRTYHRTVEPVDDLAYAEDQAFEANVVHDSDYTIGSRNPFSGKGYRRSQREMPQLRRDLKYGQYLSIPKGRRSIFQSRERQQRLRSTLALIVVIALLAVAAVLVWHLIQGMGAPTGDAAEAVTEAAETAASWIGLGLDSRLLG